MTPFPYSHRLNPSLTPFDPLEGIPFSEATVGEVLQRAGYDTALVGKWHLGSHPSQHPLRRGFNRFFGFLSGGHRYQTSELTLHSLLDVKKTRDWYYTKLLSDYTTVEHYESEWITDELTRVATEFIANHSVVKGPAAAGSSSEARRPFFLLLAYNAPHSPREASPAHRARFAHVQPWWVGKYYATVAQMDDGVGNVTSALRTHGLLEDTILVFINDHGGKDISVSSTYTYMYTLYVM